MTKSTNTIDRHRPTLIGAAAITLAATELGLVGSASAQSETACLASVKPGSQTSFGPLKQIDAGTLNVGYAKVGPANGVMRKA
jgi:hypothetical protein